VTDFRRADEVLDEDGVDDDEAKTLIVGNPLVPGPRSVEARGQSSDDGVQLLRDSEIEQFVEQLQDGEEPLELRPSAEVLRDSEIAALRIEEPAPAAELGSRGPSQAEAREQSNEVTERHPIPRTHPLANSIAPTSAAKSVAPAPAKSGPVWQIVAAAAALVALGIGLGQLRQGEPASSEPDTARAAAASAPVRAAEPVAAPAEAAEPSDDTTAVEPQPPQPVAIGAGTGGEPREQRLDGVSEARQRWLQGSESGAEPRVRRLPFARRAGGLPAQPSREQVMTTMRAAMPALSRCTGGRRGVVEVQLTVRGSGKVTYALVQGSFAGTPEGSCLARALRDVQFPEFTESSLRLSYPLQF
jgi:hypothetical protein